MKQLERIGAPLAWMRNGIRAHPFFVSCVAYLVIKQMIVLWAFLERPYTPPNMVVALTGASLLSLAWAFALRGRLRLLALAVVDAGFGALLLTDLVYFRQFADLPSVASLQYARLAADLHEVVEGLIYPRDALLFVGPVLLAVVALRWPAWLARQHRFGVRRVAVLSVVGLCLVASVTLTTRRLKKPFGGHTVVASRLGPLGYHAYDAGTFVARGLKKRFGSVEEEHAAAKDFFQNREAPPAHPLRGVARGKNVVFVQLESWQAFPTEMEVGDEQVTPHFNALASEGLRFTRFHSQVGQGTTSDAEFAAQCSLYPSRTGSVYYEHATNDMRCLPEVLREQGYTTVAMHANRPDFWNRAAMYPTVGISTYYDERSFDFTLADEIGLGLADEIFFDQAIDKLKTLPEPYYALVISITSHTPFNFPNLPRELKHDDHAGTRTAHYLDTVRYTDRALGKFVERLRREGMLEDTVLVVYGDHMGVAKDSSNVGEVLQVADGDAAKWFDVERRVPALIRVPGGAATGVNTTSAGQVDIAPTVASLLGIDTSTTAFFGRDLLAPGEGFVAFPNGSAVGDRELYLTADGGHGKAGCFAVGSGAQLPGERCQSLADRALQELQISWGMVESDLVAKVAGGSPSRAVTAL